MSSVEEETLEHPDAYAGLLDNFGSEIGSTLEDLVSDWNDDYDLEQDAENIPTKRAPRPLFKYRGSMDGGEDISDWSLMKARPLAFANPVYDLMMLGSVISKPRQMTLIPLTQFEINKPHDGDRGKSEKDKQQKKGKLMSKLSRISGRKHSLKKSEPEINVTAPLWTDAPGVLQDLPRRSGSLPATVEDVSDIIKDKEEQGSKDSPSRPPPLDLNLAKEPAASKAPPQKTPRTAKGSFNSFSPTADDSKSIADTQSPTLDLPNDEKALRSAISTSSIASDVSEDPVEEERTTKTMMEVMHEIEDDSTNKEDLNKEKDPESPAVATGTENESVGEDTPLLKRNKTLKWSGSRAAPALIREFTRKSKKAAAASGQLKQLEASAADSPETSAGESPVKSDIGDMAKPVALEAEIDLAKKSQLDRLQVESGKNSSAPSTPKKRDSSAFTILSSLLPPAPKLRRSESSKIRMYVHRMGTNPQNALGYATTEFVKQTLQSTEHRPVVILHSIRSFLTDMKKYLITNPHVGLIGKIQKIMKNMAIQDVEGAIDDALERLVLYPLRDFIYKRLVLDYARSGKIQLVEEAIKLGQTKSPQELGIRATLIPPNEEAMETVKHYFMELQTTYSPYYKLKHLLSAVTTIYENTSDLTCEDQSARKIGADDFFPLLVHAIVKCDFTAADIEAQYIDGLLDPTLLLGEGGYYLTSLISAVQLLSSMKKKETPLPNITDLQGFLKVGISSKTEKMMESDGALTHKTLHVPPSMTAHNLGMMIAKKYGMKNNAKNCCLHVVVNGVAYPLKPQEFPQLVKMDLLTQFPTDSFFFIYRQLEKVPQKPSERPTVIDSEQLKINTEEGESVFTAESEIKTSEGTESSSEVNSSNSDSESKSKQIKKAESTDELVSSNDFEPQDLGSAGFADIPLPSDVLLQHSNATPNESVAVDPPRDTSSSPDIPNPTENDPLPPPDLSNVTPPPLVDSTHMTIDEAVQSGDAILLGELSTLNENLPPPPKTSSPNHILPPPPDVADSPLDVTLTDDDRPPSIEIDALPPPPNESLDLTDVESEDDTLTDETYLRATVVDDVLSPVKKRIAAPSKDVQAILEEEEEAEDVSLQIEDSPTHPDGNIPEISQSPNMQEIRPESAMSDISIGSTGFHSDGYCGPGSDGRHSSRGYHSDSHQVDDGNAGAQTSVAKLKTYFEDEITKVTSHAARISPNLPK